MKRAACFGFGVVSILLALSAPCLAGSATQPAPQEPKPDTFLLVDVKGTIGEDFTAGNLKAALAEARASKAAAVVLNMDTPGGSIQDAEAIVNLIIENKDLRFIALVHKALSAGAAITLACKEIYVTEAATIGAAVSYTVNGRGQLVELPPDLAEKMQSAWRAVCRKAADHGEHSSLLAEGMVDKDFGVVMKKDKGKVALERVDRSSAMPKGEVIKPQGRILTLTAKEAIACELAKALVADTAGLANSLGMKQGGGVSGAVEEGSATFYNMLLNKIAALGLAGDSLTELGRKTAEKEWDSWFRSEWDKVKGRRVSWALLLRQADPPKGTLTIRVYAYAGRLFSHPRVIISANVRGTFKDAVGSISEGGTITLSGTLRDVQFQCYDYKKGYKEVHGRETKVWAMPRPDQNLSMGTIWINLDDCVLGDAEQPQPPADSRASTTAPADPEAEAKRRLNLAETYRTNGMQAQAAKTLRSIIDDFPKTASAKRAAEDLAEVEKEMKEKSAKDSSK